MTEGAVITVTAGDHDNNAPDKEVATSEAPAGRGDSLKCVISFRVKGVPTGFDYYDVRLAGRGSFLPVKEAELRDGIDLDLDDPLAR